MVVDFLIEQVQIASRKVESREALLRRILSNVKIQDEGYESKCWIWQGADSGKPNGTRGHSYGRISVMGETSAVHRVVASIVHGYIPKKKQVDHLCHVRGCCRPDHLEIVTHLQNQKRKVKK